MAIRISPSVFGGAVLFILRYLHCAFAVAGRVLGRVVNRVLCLLHRQSYDREGAWEIIDEYYRMYVL